MAGLWYDTGGVSPLDRGCEAVRKLREPWKQFSAPCSGVRKGSRGNFALYTSLLLLSAAVPSFSVSLEIAKSSCMLVIKVCP